MITTANKLQMTRIRRMSNILNVSSNIVGVKWAVKHGASWRKWFESDCKRMFNISYNIDGVPDRKEKTLNKHELKEFLGCIGYYVSLKIVKG